MLAMDIQFAYNLERLLYYTSDSTHTVQDIMLAVDDQFNFKPNAIGKKFYFLFLFFILLLLLYFDLRVMTNWFISE